MSVPIPIDRLSSDLLNSIIEEFVLREGTDYGHEEFSLEKKIESVRLQLERGRARIVYDESSESCSIERVER